jgi:hypothetical protein
MLCSDALAKKVLSNTNAQNRPLLLKHWNIGINGLKFPNFPLESSTYKVPIYLAKLELLYTLLELSTFGVQQNWNN